MPSEFINLDHKAQKTQIFWSIWLLRFSALSGEMLNVVETFSRQYRSWCISSKATQQQKEKLANKNSCEFLLGYNLKLILIKYQLIINTFLKETLIELCWRNRAYFHLKVLLSYTYFKLLLCKKHIISVLMCKNDLNIA